MSAILPVVLKDFFVMASEVYELRERIDRLVAAAYVLVRPTESTSIEERCLATEILEILQRPSNLVVPDLSSLFQRSGRFDLPNAIVPAVSAKQVKSIRDQVDSGRVTFLAEGQSGIYLAVDKSLPEMERARFAIARAIQLADRAMTNSAALRLADGALQLGIATVAAAPAMFLMAATASLWGQDGPVGQNGLVLDVPVRPQQTVSVRITSGCDGAAVLAGGGGGAPWWPLGVQFVVRGRVQLLLKGPTSGAPMANGGGFLGTLLVTHPLTEDVGVGGLLHPTALNRTILEWAIGGDNVASGDALKGDGGVVGESGNSGESGESGERDRWYDVEPAPAEPLELKTASISRGLKAGSDSRAFAPFATAELIGWGDNEYGELSQGGNLVAAPSPVAWQTITPWEKVQRSRGYAARIGWWRLVVVAGGGGGWCW
jgi:hypothetical protein